MIAALATAFGSFAADYTYTLVVNKTDGTKVNFLFESNPVARIIGDNLEITQTTTDQTYVYPFSELVNLTFDKEESGVESLKPGNGDVAFGVTATTVDVYGLNASTIVNLYDSEGALRAKGVADAGGSATLDITGLPKGVYIVTAGKHTFKFIR